MLRGIILGLIDLYQGHLRIMLPASCRFTPSCSEHLRQAIVKYGLFKGMRKGICRIALCHPFSGKSGYDPLI